MKVILLQDVANVGLRHQVAEVPNGHALNMLIPKGLAQPATPANLKRVESQQGQVAASIEAKLETFKSALAGLADVTHTLEIEANDEGHLFQGLKAEAIAASLTEAGHYILASQIILAEPIKAIGEHTIALKEGTEKGSFTLSVVKK